MVLVQALGALIVALLAIAPSAFAASRLTLVGTPTPGATVHIAGRVPARLGDVTKARLELRNGRRWRAQGTTKVKHRAFSIALTVPRRSTAVSVRVILLAGSRSRGPSKVLSFRVRHTASSTQGPVSASGATTPVVALPRPADTLSPPTVTATTPTPDTTSAPPAELKAGDELHAGQGLVSANGEFSLIMQTDGNLVMYNNWGRAEWDSGTEGHDGVILAMQGDGNLVLYAPGGVAIWDAGTEGTAGREVHVAPNGDLQVRAPGGGVVWHTGSRADGLVRGEGLDGTRSHVLTSPNQQFALTMQPDGNLVLRSTSQGRALWSAGTGGSGATHVDMQNDGNLVIYRPDGQPVWSSGSAGTAGSHLEVQNDGNLVIYPPSGPAIWSTGTHQDTLAAGESLDGNWAQTLYSAGGRYELAMQNDGNLVLYRNDTGQAIWASWTDGHPGSHADMQPDGNLVVYSPDGSPLWRSGTEGHPGASLSVQEDGNVVVYAPGGSALWNIGPAGGGGSNAGGAPDVGTPGWWNGDCDSGGYGGAHRLGAVWHGLVACGPRRLGDGGYDRTVHFFPGAWGEYEWECVELSMRWLYLAYGVHPYSANGDQVVNNYSGAAGGGLVKIANGTHGVAPQPGDVLAFPRVHTAVVTASSVDGAGNGTVTVIEQNASANGWDTYAVHGWSVAGVSGWLHKP